MNSGRFSGGYRDQDGRVHQLPDGVLPKWRPSAYALILRSEPERQILMVKPRCGSGVWELPGGGVNPLESVVEGLVRETLEETGYHIRVPEKQRLLIGETSFFTESQGFCHTLLLIHRASLAFPEQDPQPNNTDPTDPHEIAEVAWQPLKSLNLRVCHMMFHDVLRELMNETER